MKTISEMKHDENTKAAEIIKNMPNAAILPCTGKTSSHMGENGEVVYKYNGSFCGASFAIPQIAGLFLLAKQIDPSIIYDEFIEIVKNPERLNSDGMMYVDAEKIIEEISKRSKIKGQPLSISQKVSQRISSDRLLRETTIY